MFRLRVVSTMVRVLAVASAGVLAGTSHVVLAQCELAKLTPSPGTMNEWFGYAVAISNQIAVVGAPGQASGSVYTFRRLGATWIAGTPLVPINGASFDFFGSSVALEGNVLVVGAPGDDEAGTNAGAAYVYRWNGSGWLEVQKLIAADSGTGDGLGHALDVNGRVVVVAAPFDDELGTDSGAAYIFRHESEMWREEAKLLGDDITTRDRFGLAVSITNDLVAVSAPSKRTVYLFQKGGSTWTQKGRLIGSPLRPQDAYGSSVSIDNSTVLVGNPAVGTEDGSGGPGSAFTFSEDGVSWTQRQEVSASDFVSLEDHFGASVSLAADRVFIGAPAARDANRAFAGAAYLFEYDGATWVERGRTNRSDAIAGDFFAGSVALEVEYAIAGAHQRDDACPSDLFCNSGAAYILRVSYMHTDLVDFGRFGRCYMPTPITLDSCCRLFDTNEDGAVDSTDYRSFANVFVGPGAPPIAQRWVGAR